MLKFATRVFGIGLCLTVLGMGLSGCGGGESASPEDQIGEESPGQSQGDPNILLIISDDQGLDASAQYTVSADRPSTPVLDGLANAGLVFENVWATPSCTTTRASLITGQHGINSGVDRTPNLLDTGINTLQKQLRLESTMAAYSTAVIGKWHLAGGNSSLVNHPNESGVGYYAGTIAGTIDDYYDWPLTVDGQTLTSTTYHTTALTDLVIDWLGQQQDAPWFLWLAFVAPHAPFHLPPASLHNRSLAGSVADIAANPRPYYLAAIEAMDTEIGRLLDSLSEEDRANTIILFVGDNGTPQAVIDTVAYPRSHSKNSLYEGGIRVPMIASGARVSRAGEREAALVNTTDVFPTLIDLAGRASAIDLDGQSFASLLSSGSGSARDYNYSEFVSDDTSGWTVRNERLKLIEFSDGTRELFDLSVDGREEADLIADSAIYATQIEAMDAFATAIRSRDD